MQLYTLTSRFFPRDSINEFTSVIWTERYSSAGDVQLVVPATAEMAEILAPGTMLGLRGTKEIMMLETQSVEKELMTVTGLSMVSFFNERSSLFPNPEYDGTSGSAFGEYTATTTAGQHISDAVYQMLINPTSTLGLDWAQDKIPGLSLGAIDANGTPKRISFALGPIYDAVQSLASEEGLGFKLYLESAKYSTDVYVLKFATYRGRNRTSEQAVHGIVRLSPQLDSLTDVKELSSISEYKNVIYVSYKNTISTHYIQPDLPIPTGFNRRALFVEAPDIFLTDDHIAEFRAQVARNTLANHIYIQAVDGQVSSKIDYKFGTDYYLGDVVELEGFSGFFSKARITEYIRSQDQFGEQEYPTLAVIDPLQTGYMPDLEPNPGSNDFDGDPDYDLDLDLDDWDKDDPASDYDPEHDPNKRKKKRPTDPKDPNPDPVPVFPDDPTGGGGDDGGGGGAGDRQYILLGYYPNQNNGEAIGYLHYGGTEPPDIAEGWIYTTEDPTPDIYVNWLEVLPLGWTLDNKKMLVRSEDSKESTDARPWSQGYAYWLLDPTDGSTQKLTDTFPTNSQVDGLLGSKHSWDSPGELWCGSDENWHWYLTSSNTQYPLGGDAYGPEYLYADGTYTSDGAAVGHGDRMATGPGPRELYAAWGGTGEGQATIEEMTRILYKEDFPPSMRWSGMNVYPSPDGEKLVIARRHTRPPTFFILSCFGSLFEGTFRITVGVFGNLISGAFTTNPIPYDATAEQVYNELLLIPYLQDPRTHGYPYTPYVLAGGGLLQNGAQLQMQFDVVPPAGVYMVTHNEDIVPGPISTGYYFYNQPFAETGDPVWYLADYNGPNLTEIDIGDLPNYFGGWSPDSTKLHGVVPSPSGDANRRWMNYDIATGDISYPLDYSGLPPDSYGTKETILGPPKFSPDGQKIAYFMQGDYRSPRRLIVANADGSNALAIYENVDNPGQTDLVLGYAVSWSFDSKKLAVVDDRDEVPVWIFNLVPNTMTQIWPGSGWDNSADQYWIYDPQNFDG